jgi:hypothetical protein
MTLGVHLYYPVEKHSQHKISTLKANDHILAGLPLSRNSNSISHTAHPNAPPPCWTEIIHMKRHEQQQVANMSPSILMTCLSVTVTGERRKGSSTTAWCTSAITRI